MQCYLLIYRSATEICYVFIAAVFQVFLICLHPSLRISLSKAHTKLSLRKKVLEEDALIAILLFESSLTLKHGKSVFSLEYNCFHVWSV